ncbi:MAG: DUF2892 domain-containing protein [Pseudomonadota bacterium]
MMRNMGKIDRAGRLIIAALLAYLVLSAGIITGVPFWIALAVAAVFTLTALVGNCPLYRIIGLKTCRDC